MRRHFSLGWSIAASLPMALAMAGGCASDEVPKDDGTPVAVDTTGTSSGTGSGTTGSSSPAATTAPPAASTPAAMVTTSPSTVASASAPTSSSAGNENAGGGGSAGTAGSESSAGPSNSGGAEGVSQGGAGPSTADAGAAEGMGGASSSAGGAAAAASGGSGATDVDGGAGASGQPTDPNSPGCGTAITRPDRNVQQTLEMGGTTRYYLLDVPENADNQTPLMLIFGLHGFDMNNVAVKDLYNFTERSNGQAITVMPQGEGPPPGDVSHWGDEVLESTWSANQANYDYIEALIRTLGESYCIDRSRVFIVGFSMGAFFTNAIACEHTDWFRAFAPIAGGGPSACGDDVQAPIMLQHGTVDPIVEISSGEESRDIWLEQNGCSQSSTSSFDGCESYDGCAEGKPVVWCTGNFDHYIPESTTSNIWAFFSGL